MNTVTSWTPNKAWIFFTGKIVSSQTFIPIMCWQNGHLYCWDNDVRPQPLTFIFSKQVSWAGWPRRWHLHESSSEEQWGLLAGNRTTIYHCSLIKFIRGRCMGLKNDVKFINQSQMDYTVYGFCPVARSRRYKGLKGGNSVCVCEYIKMRAFVRVISQWVMISSGSTYWSGEPEEVDEVERQQHNQHPPLPPPTNRLKTRLGLRRFTWFLVHAKAIISAWLLFCCCCCFFNIEK